MTGGGLGGQVLDPAGPEPPAFPDVRPEVRLRDAAVPGHLAVGIAPAFPRVDRGQVRRPGGGDRPLAGRQVGDPRHAHPAVAPALRAGPLEQVVAPQGFGGRDVDHPGQIHPGHVGWLDAGGHGPVPAGPESQVGWVHRRRGDPHPHLARPGRRNRQPDKPQHLRPAELSEPHRPHPRHVPHSLPSARIASSSSTPRTRRCGRRETGSPS